MRKERNGEETRQSVIATAKKVFSERGFTGASLAMISDRCGISTGLILHHFKSKDLLYRTVLNDLAEEYADAVMQPLKAGIDPVEMMPAMLRATIQYWCSDQVYLRIAAWAELENRAELVEAEAKLTSGLADKLKEMQARGMIDSRINPLVLLSATIGPIHFWVRHRGFFQSTGLTDLSPQEQEDLFQEQFGSLVVKMYQV